MAPWHRRAKSRRRQYLADSTLQVQTMRSLLLVFAVLSTSVLFAGLDGLVLVLVVLGVLKM